MAGLNYAELYGVDFVSVRMAANYGPPITSAQPRAGAGTITTFVINALDGKPTVLEKGGDQRIEYTYVLDTVNGWALAHRAEKLKHRVYNISSGRLNSLFETAEVVRKLIPGADIKVGSGFLTGRGWRRPPFDLTRANEELGYTPKYADLEKGVSSYINWLRQARG